jgi:hypothetical protein
MPRRQLKGQKREAENVCLVGPCMKDGTGSGREAKGLE